MNSRILLVFLFSLFSFLAFLSGCVGTAPEKITFVDSGNPSLCLSDGKPIIRMYSTTTCPHCKWVGPAFDEVAQKYVAEGKIVARHWNLDSKDDVLSVEKETEVPTLELSVFQSFNSNQTVPTFVFGCKYYRIGTAFERENNLEAEKEQFREFIEKTLSDLNNFK